MNNSSLKRWLLQLWNRIHNIDLICSSPKVSCSTSKLYKSFFMFRGFCSLWLTSAAFSLWTYRLARRPRCPSFPSRGRSRGWTWRPRGGRWCSRGVPSGRSWPTGWVRRPFGPDYVRWLATYCWFFRSFPFPVCKIIKRG